MARSPGESLGVVVHHSPSIHTLAPPLNVGTFSTVRHEWYVTWVPHMHNKAFVCRTVVGCAISAGCGGLLFGAPMICFHARHCIALQSRSLGLTDSFHNSASMSCIRGI